MLRKVQKDQPFHRNYHEVRAGNHAELGARLAHLFGAVSRSYVEEARSEPDWRRRVAAADPLLRCSQQYFPNLIAELASYAEVADIPLGELWALNCESETEEHCTTVVTNDGALIGHNEDWDDDAAADICIVKKSLPHITLFGLHYYDAPLGGTAFSINSHGSIQAINSLSHIDRAQGVPKNVIARWLSESADIERDFRALAALPRASGFNHVIVQAGGQAYDLECTARRQHLARLKLPYAHANHYLASPLLPFEAAEPDDSTFLRYRRACAGMQPRMSMESLGRLMADSGAGKRNSIFNRDTIGRVIVDMSARIARIWLKRETTLGFIDYSLDWVAA